MGGTDFAERGATSVENTLAHYGRRGMKWGRHIFTTGGRSKKSSESSSTTKREVSEDHSRAAAALKKHPSSLSNKEMQDLITRMNLEQQYSRVVAPVHAKPTTRTTKTRKWVQNLLLDVGKTEVSRVSKAASAMAVERALAKSGHATLAKRIAPKKKK